MVRSQTNPNSLANLRKPKTRKEDYGYRYAINQEKVDELFSHLAQGMTLKKAADAAGVCFATAKKYYKQGDANRGIQPLIQRIQVFNERISNKVNVLLEEQRMQRLVFVRNLIKKAQQSMFDNHRFFDKDGNQIEVFNDRGEKIESYSFQKFKFSDLDKLMRLEDFLAGGKSDDKEDEPKEVTMLTAEQIMMDNQS